MTVHRSYNEIEFHCDGCHEVFESQTKDFEEAVELLQEADWATRKTGKDFLHICPDCIKAEGSPF